MEYTQSALKHLFLQQSYLDAWKEYERQLTSKKALIWDYVILTASNEAQAEIYRQQICYRLKNGTLTNRTCYEVIADPNGKRVGSGGATLNVLVWIAQRSKGEDRFRGKRILIIHSGGDSKRIPQYSVSGKLFAPVPRELPNGMASTLFDEFMIAVSMVPGRIEEGMLVLSGDVLLLFNALQIDCQFHGAAAISMKEDVSVGKNHGVFLNDGNDMVKKFLHKQPEEMLRRAGAVNSEGQIDLDTGAILLEPEILEALYSLISSDGEIDTIKYQKFINEKTRISFYGDFLYPLATSSTLEQYLEEMPEGEFSEELESCRREIWNVLKSYNLKMLSLSPAEFIHFGTTNELLQLVTKSIWEYSFLEWKNIVSTNVIEQRMLELDTKNISIQNSLIQQDVIIGEGSYLENCYLYHGTQIGRGCIISGVTLSEVEIPDSVVLHGVKLLGECFVVRIYAVTDNPKQQGREAGFLSTTLDRFMNENELSESELWETDDFSLWYARLYPVCATMKEAIEMSLVVYRMAKGKASLQEIKKWKAARRESLFSSFYMADGQAILPWQEKLKNRILIERFIEKIRQKQELVEAFQIFYPKMNEKQYYLLLERADQSTLSEQIRIYYVLAQMIERGKVLNHKSTSEDFYELCFGTIRRTILGCLKGNGMTIQNVRIVEDNVDVCLPVRVNWGGGWTDTPPYCIENGGVVLNAAIKLRGEYPIRISLRRTEKCGIELESQDIGVKGYFDSLEDLQECSNPYDYFALHKSALIACGVIPLQTELTLQSILKNLGGGIYLSTQVLGIPKGSGLGTSSILAAACVKGIYEFLGKTISNNDLYRTVLCMEQLMSTGGGWQDQVGGLTPGIKFITTTPGLQQKIRVQEVVLSQDVYQELNERFALIYTGQRRLARNLLRDVVGGYIGGRPESVDALKKMSRLAALMRFELEQGNIDEFAVLLNEHWNISVQLDQGSTNTCIEQIFFSCEDLIDGKFIAGAGGGGFLQVILKNGVTKEQLRKRLKGVFQDSGVDVWDCEILAETL